MTCPPCTPDTLHLSPDGRFDWMNEYQLSRPCGDCPHAFAWLGMIGLSDQRATLAAARILWLTVEADVFGRRRARAMPGDPQPEFWQVRRPRRTGGSEFEGTIHDRLRGGYRVEDMAGRHTVLRGNGRVLTGKCPLHNERHGEAFVVWVDDQKWRCFGACNIGGDVQDLARALYERNLDWRPTPTSR